ncbi:uncharacterized protein LOC129606002 [Condylostylus longicornis]|uniref:uncharacterized protein LOC129606002 n=1 Tax=Condylostylus longicornis TaxID=2530218 RepID=UPI00244DF1DF|nr:uncharacterized protein LOC129606002 [Condylostylus longicornis]
MLNIKKNNKMYLLILLILLINNISGYIPDDQIKGVYCGKVLTRAIEEICPNGINGPKLSQRRKRVFSTESNKELSAFDTDDQNNDYEVIQWPSGLYKTDGYYTTRYRRSLLINIVQECCKNPCSVATLRQYCN